MPGEAGTPTLTGRELIAIEDTFGLDALQLLASLSPDVAEKPGYTRSKALFALAWVAVHRVDPAMTLPGFLDVVALDELDIVESENPTNAASSAAEPAVE